MIEHIRNRILYILAMGFRKEQILMAKIMSILSLRQKFPYSYFLNNSMVDFEVFTSLEGEMMIDLRKQFFYKSKQLICHNFTYIYIKKGKIKKVGLSQFYLYLAHNEHINVKYKQKNIRTFFNY
ncbi:hypothetical protein M153_129000858 [Pseudoloma neurophilia]|uniref:Uncharacterized protein n=1 Tax=Pseudoloma neurophilia TaxID=146866 RepID=A0A0R0M3Z1_9MICR|nr:hypothetical protein M153_129000858 [Pseudoloma neurophilia]